METGDHYTVVIDRPVDFAWRRYGVEGRNAVHHAVREVHTTCDDPNIDPLLCSFPLLGRRIVSACGREALVYDVLEKSSGYLPIWQVDEPVTCKRCLRKDKS